MPSPATSSSAPQDRRRITSRKVVRVGGRADAVDDSLAVWAERYLDLAVRGVRSAELAF